MTDFFNHFHFLRPEWLGLLPGLLLLEWMLHKQQHSSDNFEKIIDPALLAALRVQGTKGRWFTPTTALALLFLLVTLILAGPTWRQQPSPLAENTTPLVMVLDVSESMDSTDIAPTRLERAVQKMTDLIDLTPDRPVAIIVFAGSAHTVIPLTTDREILKNFLSVLRVGIAPRRGKYPEYALSGIDRILTGNPNRANILLVGDGLGADSLELVSSWCRRQPHALTVLGVGTAQPISNGVPLDRAGLLALADACVGDYVDITVGPEDVEGIAKSLRDSYRILEDDALPWVDAGYGLLLPAMGLGLLWFRQGWTRLWMALLLPLALAMPSEGWAQIRQDRQPLPVDTMDPDIPEDSTDWFHTAVDGFVGLWLTPDQYGALLLKLGHYEKAAQTFHDPGWQGVAYYYAEDFERAALLFTRQDSATALFNEANARAHQRDYVGALARYDELLTAEPELSSALTNRNLMRQIIEESNRLSESQSNEAGVSGEDIDPEAGAQIADGANELSVEQQTLVQYSAEEILASPELANLWLQNVQPDPSNFLRNKFSAQLQERGVSEP